MTSRLFNFGSFGSFGSVPTNPTKENIQNYAMSGELDKLKTAMGNAKLLYHEVIDQYGSTLLHLATLSRQYNVIEFLLTTTVDQNKENYFKQTAFDVAPRRSTPFWSDRKITRPPRATTS